MQHAIDLLQIAFHSAVHNEQIQRSEGRVEEAERNRENAESLSEGFSFLQSVRDGHFKESTTFLGKISRAINCHSLENGSDTPDFILGEYLKRCLENFDLTVQARTAYFGQQAELVEEPAPNEVGYRMLSEGEVLQEDDEYELANGSWRKTTAAGGLVARGGGAGGMLYRRPLKCSLDSPSQSDSITK